MIHDSIAFFLEFYMYLKTSLSSILPKLIEKTKKIFEAKQKQDITPNRILKRGLIENLNGFLKTTKKFIKKKRRLVNAFKQKLNIDKQNSKTVVINNIGNLDKKELPNSSIAPIFEKNVKDVAIIGADAYSLTYKLK